MPVLLKKSGPGKGQLKKGYRYTGKATCPVMVEVKTNPRSECEGITKSGKRKGKLQKGYKYEAGKVCPVKVGG